MLVRADEEGRPDGSAYILLAVYNGRFRGKECCRRVR